jgi:hypothetical protein
MQQKLTSIRSGPPRFKNNTPNFRFFSKSLFFNRFISLLDDVFITDEVDCNDDDDDDDDVDDNDDMEDDDDDVKVDEVVDKEDDDIA